MTSAVNAASSQDRTELPHLLRSAVMLAVLQSVLIVLFSFASRSFTGGIKVAVEAVIVVVGVGATIALPGLWTRARTIEGIAGAAGLSLAAAGVFVLIDSILLQPLGIYTNRWREIGGGSNWWYHPVWWMVATYLAWMGGWVLANQTARSGAPNAGVLVGGTMILAAIIMVIAKLSGVPGAAYGVGTFAVAILPAVALMTIITGLGARRG
jgi:hypothetical protein